LTVATRTTKRAARVGAGGPAALTVLAEICYPLTSGGARAWLIVIIVALFASTMLLHAGLEVGSSAVAVLVLVGLIGLAAEIIGLHTGVPFGEYGYIHAAGLRIFGVPLIVALAWLMMAWPSALGARLLARSPAGRVAIGAWALASWDLFLDPQLTAAAVWRWRRVGAHLPGVADVPLTNYAGWIAVSLVISMVLQRFLGSRPVDDTVPNALYLWTYASSILALAAFLDLAAAAAWGALGMGLVAVPLALRMRK
jgi:uncharacterized membrane protein